MILFRSCVCCVTFIVYLFCATGHPVGDLSDVKRKSDEKNQWPSLSQILWPDQDGSSEQVVKLVNGLNEKFIDGSENASVKHKVANIVNNIYLISAINGTIVSLGHSLGEICSSKDSNNEIDTATSIKPPKYCNSSRATTTEKTVYQSTKKTNRSCSTTSCTAEDNNTPITCRCPSKNV